MEVIVDKKNSDRLGGLLTLLFFIGIPVGVAGFFTSMEIDKEDYAEITEELKKFPELSTHFDYIMENGYISNYERGTWRQKVLDLEEIIEAKELEKQKKEAVEIRKKLSGTGQ